MSRLDKSKNTMQIMRGGFKTTVGKTTRNTSFQTNGGADQLMGHLKQFGEKVKDAFRK